MSRQPADEIETALAERLKDIRERVLESVLRSGRRDGDVRILAVTKTVPPEQVNFVLENGIGWIGENRVQEYLDKRGHYRIEPENVHFIGHLQSNKVKYIIDKVGMIESVGSVRLAEEIDRRAAAARRKMEVLLEVNIAAEESKSGFLEAGLSTAIEAVASLEHLQVKGLMCIPQKNRGDYYFAKMESLFRELRAKGLPGVDLTWLSMGMSADYEEAILHGANIVRLGSALFGERK